MIPIGESRYSVMQNTGFILVIKGVTMADYERIRQDLEGQFKERGLEPPYFCSLPGEYPEIEIIWIDELVELEKHSEAIKSINNPKLDKITEEIKSGKIRYDWEAMQVLEGD